MSLLQPFTITVSSVRHTFGVSWHSRWVRTLMARSTWSSSPISRMVLHSLGSHARLYQRRHTRAQRHSWLVGRWERICRRVWSGRRSMGAWWWLFDWRERVWVPGWEWTTATVSAGAEEEEEELVSWPLLERAGEEREEDLDGRIRPGLGVLRVRVLESKPEQKEDKMNVSIAMKRGQN